MTGLKIKSIFEKLTTPRSAALGEFVNLASYTSESSAYTAPSDGYVFVYNTSSQTGYLTVKGSTDDNSTVAVGAAGGRTSLFVRKGMKIYLTGTSSAVRFSPISGG